MAEGTTTMNYEEIQEMEISALRAIFMDNFEEKKTKGAWNKKADREFVLNLHPLAGTENEDLVLDLHVLLPATYPKTLPICRVAYYGRIPAKCRTCITRILQDKPKELLGTESIYELATSIQDVLEEANTSLNETQHRPTLEQERADQELEAQRQADETKAHDEHRQRLADDEEERLLAEMVKQERSRLAKLQEKPQRQPNSPHSDGEPKGDCMFDQEIRIRQPGKATFIVFRSVIKKSLLSSGPVTDVCSAEPILLDTSESYGDGEPVSLILKTCTVRSEKRDVQNLEAMMQTLLELDIKDTGVLQPLAFRITKIPGNHLDWSINILEPFVKQRSIRDLLQTIRRIDIADMRPWLNQVLEGIQFLHQNHLVHGRLNVDNILLDINESGVATVKITDGAYKNVLHTLHHGGSTRFSSAASSEWMAPESGAKGNTKVQPPQDIWDFGVFMLQSLFGLDVQRRYLSPLSLKDDFDFSDSFKELLNHVFRADVKKRPTAFDILSKLFLRTDEPIEGPVDAFDDSEAASRSLVSSKPLRGRRESNAGPTKASRYASDFVELGRLGKGGFGEVVKARNKLDGTTYAIKKISQPSGSSLDGVLSEVMLLSRLNHPFVVRYYTVWVEESLVGYPLQNDSSSEEEDEEEEDGYEDEDENGDQGTDDEIGLSNITGTKTLGLDFISSSGRYHQIEFATDDDQDDVQNTDQDDAIESSSQSGSDLTEGQHDVSVSAPHRRKSSVSTASKVTLYIQMEYCESRSLRDVFHILHSNTGECWRLFRQILDCLAHIHKNGILHRDLKPDNIFLTKDAGDLPCVKVGDFGLARLGESSARPKHHEFVIPELTASIGTTLYVAPEVRSSGGGTYNDKADMYALGIILFEMSYELTTAMERVHTLEALRKPNFEFPIVFQQPEKQLQADIIKLLVRQKPAERPSSQELLHNNKIPSPVEDEAIRNALQTLSDRSSPTFSRLMEKLFVQMSRNADPRDLTYDLDNNMLSKPADMLLLDSMLKSKLISVFSRHGAVETKRQHLLPVSDHYDSAVCLLDPSGSLLQLPYDLTLPYARSVAKQSEVVRKSFSFGQVFRKAPAGTHPSGHGEVDFDIVTEETLDLALREAEAIKVMDEAIDAMPAMASLPIVYYLTHSKLLEVIFHFCGIANRKDIKQIISRLHVGGNSWGRIRNELREPDIGVASTSLDELMRFDFREPYDTAVQKLRDLLEDSTEELASTFRHLEAVTIYLERFRVKRKVLISPLNAVQEHFYHGGLMFQCINDSKRRKVIGAGGRYDSLISENRAGTKFNRHGVGFNLAWDLMVETMLRFINPSGKQLQKKADDDVIRASWKPRRCDVLVDAVDARTLRSSGIDIVQELWANDISAELVIDSPARELASYQNIQKDGTSSYHWGILIKQDGVLKIRNLVRREDTEVRRSELISWLRADARDRDRERGTGRSGPHSSSGGGNEGGGHVEGRSGDVQVLVAEHRSKKFNRRNIVDEALTRTASINSSFGSAPIAAMELKDDLFDAIRETRLSEPESWRRCIQNAPLAERQYLGQVQSLLLEHANGKDGQGPRAVWLYNFRSRSCFLYDLGKDPPK